MAADPQVPAKRKLSHLPRGTARRTEDLWKQGSAQSPLLQTKLYRAQPCSFVYALSTADFILFYFAALGLEPRASCKCSTPAHGCFYAVTAELRGHLSCKESIYCLILYGRSLSATAMKFGKGLVCWWLFPISSSQMPKKKAISH